MRWYKKGYLQYYTKQIEFERNRRIDLQLVQPAAEDGRSRYSILVPTSTLFLRHHFIVGMCDHTVRGQES